MPRRTRIGLVTPSSIFVLGLLSACSSDHVDASTAADPVGSVASALSVSAAHAQVPRDLLLAIAKVEDGLALPAERLDLDVDNEVPAAGPLQLRRGKLDTLRRGAELVHTTELELRKHSDLALEAGALVLAELGTKTGARSGDLASWNAAVEEMSGFADDAHREHYAHQVFATLARGGRFEARDGEIVDLPSHDLPPSLTIDVSQKLRVLADKAQFEGAEWIPTSCTDKCTAGRGSFNVELVVIHDTEGGWNASVATLQNDPGKSVQYIIDTNGRIGQFVTEETTAWHAGNFNFNQRSVGIEHVGYATKPFAEAEYAASAKLVDYLTKKYNIPRDRAHVIGHDQIPNGNKIAQSSAPCDDSPKECQTSPNYGGASRHTDPGIWEWPTFMARFGGKAKCNDVTERWTCSHDKTKAFRCANDAVELLTCDGARACEASEDADATCDVAPKSTPVPAEESPPAPAQPGRPTSGFLEPKGTTPVQDTNGCSIGRGMSSHAPPGAWCALALAGAVALVRRRR
jgi:N-acetyl-anhydromuramyl-L-alanine amidase AmpD